MEGNHTPVLLNEALEGLRVRPDGIYVDGTLGGGGHALAICERLSEKGRLVGIDRDEAAILASGERLSGHADTVTIVRDDYSHMGEVLAGLGIRAVDGILLDLGVSSFQLDDAGRGFSYLKDAPLDMRMDRRQERTARDIVNGYGEEELRRVLWDYGEERHARGIARAIVARRAEAPIETTGELADICKGAVPARERREEGHPARRTFQAIRIELNGELDGLEGSLDEMIGLLAEGARICVITFHSLEDRIVKNAFRRNESPCTCPPDFPVCVCGKRPRGRVVTRRPIVPGEEEIAGNRRARSAKLRIFEKNTDLGQHEGARGNGLAS